MHRKHNRRAAQYQRQREKMRHYYHRLNPFINFTAIRSIESILKCSNKLVNLRELLPKSKKTFEIHVCECSACV